MPSTQTHTFDGVHHSGSKSFKLIVPLSDPVDDHDYDDDEEEDDDVEEETHTRIEAVHNDNNDDDDDTVEDYEALKVTIRRCVLRRRGAWSLRQLLLRALLVHVPC